MNIMDLVPIVGITAGCLLTGYVFSKIVGLIKYWIDRRDNGSEDIDNLLREFNNYKHSVERRLQNLETIASEENVSPLINLDENRDTSAEHEPGITDNRLQNMLKKTR